MGFNLPADVWLAPGDAGAVAFAALAALAVASVRHRTFRRRSRAAAFAPPTLRLDEALPILPSTESPLLNGTYRDRTVYMAFDADGAVLVSLALTSHAAQGLEIGAGAPTESTPFSTLSRTRLTRLPTPWSLAIRGRRMWLRVPGDPHDPILLRRRLELACDLADEWDTVSENR